MRTASGIGMLLILTAWTGTIVMFVVFGHTDRVRSATAAKLPAAVHIRHLPARNALKRQVVSRVVLSASRVHRPARTATVYASKRQVVHRVVLSASVVHRPAGTANVYASTLSGKLSAQVAGVPERVYVPNSGEGTVDVIDPRTFRVVDHFDVGAIPHHITPSWDLSRLYVDNEQSSSLTVIDPRKGKPVGTVNISFPYNLYFTPDGRKAVVVVERLSRLDFRDPHSWNLIKSIYFPWAGVDHMDFSRDGRYLLASTEWTGQVVKVDTVAMKIAGTVDVGGLPVDVRLSPDGSVFYVTNQGRNGVSIVDPVKMKELAFLPTGAGAHGLTISRDTRSMYVSNRLAGTISVIDCRTRRVVTTWYVGGSPDMLQVSPDGRQLWFTDRYDRTVNVIDTRTGRLLRQILVGFQPHGLSYFPNAGRISVGHNGVYR